MASVPVSGSNGLGSRPGRGHCLLFNLVLDAFQLSVVKPKQSDNGQVTTTKNNLGNQFQLKTNALARALNVGKRVRKLIFQLIGLVW